MNANNNNANANAPAAAAIRAAIVNGTPRTIPGVHCPAPLFNAANARAVYRIAAQTVKSRFAWLYTGNAPGDDVAAAGPVRIVQAAKKPAAPRENTSSKKRPAARRAPRKNVGGNPRHDELRKQAVAIQARINAAGGDFSGWIMRLDTDTFLRERRENYTLRNGVTVKVGTGEYDNAARNVERGTGDILADALDYIHAAAARIIADAPRTIAGAYRAAGRGVNALDYQYRKADGDNANGKDSKIGVVSLDALTDAAAAAMDAADAANMDADAANLYAAPRATDAAARAVVESMDANADAADAADALTDADAANDMDNAENGETRRAWAYLQTARRPARQIAAAAAVYGDGAPGDIVRPRDIAETWIKRPDNAPDYAREIAANMDADAARKKIAASVSNDLKALAKDERLHVLLLSDIARPVVTLKDAAPVAIPGAPRGFERSERSERGRNARAVERELKRRAAAARIADNCKAAGIAPEEYAARIADARADYIARTNAAADAKKAPRPVEWTPETDAARAARIADAAALDAAARNVPGFDGAKLENAAAARAGVKWTRPRPVARPRKTDAPAAPVYIDGENANAAAARAAIKAERNARAALDAAREKYAAAAAAAYNTPGTWTRSALDAAREIYAAALDAARIAIA